MSDIQDRLLSADLETEMKTSFIAYAMAVIINRALPDVRDGLKPVHRRILYDMNELGMTPDKPTRKSARLVGDVLGKFHPHGDASVYDAMVRLAQDFNMRYKLVDGQGNFGSVDGDGAAAMRYTEARMSKICTYMLADIEKDTVDFMPNFDETLMQPTVLPSRFPNLLVNGSSGIAVGMATNIPPHNLGEVIDGAICLIDNPDAGLDELMEHIKGPDFPTGGIILGRTGIREAYYTGRGKITVRGRTNIEEMGNSRQRIVISEIPYGVNKAKLVEKIAELVHEKRLEGVSDIRDESDRNGMRIVIELKRDVQSQVVLNFLYKHTQLQDTFGAIMLALVDGQPKVLSLRDMLYYYIKHQEEVLTRRTRYDLDKSLARAHILEGLLKALDNIDEIVQIIRSSKDPNEAKAVMMERFGFSDKQAQAILDMRLARLTGLERDKLLQEYEELERTIEYLNSLLADRDKLMGVVKDELTEIKNKFGDKRRSELSVIEGEIDIADLIAVDDMVVTLTHFGYVKRLSKSTYRAQNRGGKGVSGMTTREEDYAEYIRTINSHDDVMFFTNMGRVYTLKCYEIPECSRTARGTAIVNLLQLSPGEKVTTMIPMPEAEDGKCLIMATRNAVIKKTMLSEFRHLRKSGLIAIVLNEGDELVGVEECMDGQELMLGTRGGRAIRFNERLVRAMGRASHGVRSMRLDEGDIVTDMCVVEEGALVLNISENGYGKRSDPEDYRETNRGGKGVTAMKLTDKTGPMVCQLMVHEDEDIILITDDGTIIRTAAADVRACGRVSQGVRLMRIAEGSRIVGIARVDKEEEEADETPVTGDGTEIEAETEAADETDEFSGAVTDSETGAESEAGETDDEV
ncbi:MAG: DNA gyrase subunit A [Clostridiales bacterium]|nr:DNA gyrase subunit A [Clostridiales bacterium]